MAIPVPRPSFETTLSETYDAGATTLKIGTTLDDAGNDLDGLTLAFVIAKGVAGEEDFIIGTVDTANSQLTSVSNLNIATGAVAGAGTANDHRVTDSVTITAFPYLTQAIRALNGTDQLDSTSPMEYDGNPSFTPGSNEVVTVKYADDLAIAGAPDATTTVKGIVEIATAAEVDAGTDTGGTGAALVAPPSEIAANVQEQTWKRAADTGAADAYVITVTPAPSAYVAGQEFQFMAANPCTGASTLDVNSLGVKNIKKYAAGAIADLEANDIVTGSCVEVVYDGTQFILETPSAAGLTTAQSVELAALADASDISGAELESLSDGSDATDLHKHSFLQGPGGATEVKDYWVLTYPYQSLVGISGTKAIGSGFYLTNSGGVNQITTDGIFFDTDTTVRKFSDSGKIILEFGAAYTRDATGEGFFGLESAGGPNTDYDDQTADAVGFSYDAAGALYAHTSDAGVGHTETAIAGITATDMNTYRVEFDPGVDAKFYVNGVLEATINTNLPGGAVDIKFGFGQSAGGASSRTMAFTELKVAIEK